MVFLRYAVLLLHVSASYGFHLAHINPHKTVHATVHRPVPQRQLRCGAVRAATVVVTDMDETLISKKSTGYVIKFLVFYRAFLRLACLAIPAFVVLKPISWFSRSAAVKVLYWLAFRGIRVDKAERIAETKLTALYAADLRDPATGAVLDADEAVVLTASPEFMARPWLQQHLGVLPQNVYGATLEVRNGRFTGATGRLPLGQAKVELLKQCDVCTGADVETIGYGDHPTDVPFLDACSKGILVHDLPADQRGSCEYDAMRPIAEETRRKLLT